MGHRAIVAVTRVLPVVIAASFAGGGPAVAQKPPADAGGKLSVPWIMRGPEIVGREPSEIRWSPEGRWIYFRWLPKSVADSLGRLLVGGSTSRDGRRYRLILEWFDRWLPKR